MSTLSNPLFVRGQYKNLKVPIPSMAGIVSTRKEPFSLAISIAEAEKDFNSRENVHREVLFECKGAERARAGVNAIAATSEGVVHPDEGLCDAVEPLTHPGETDEWANAGVEIDSYGKTGDRQPHFRTIIPRQTGGDDRDTAYLSIPNRIAEVRLSDRMVGRAVGDIAMQNFRLEGMRDERLCHLYNYRCGAGVQGPSDEARNNAYLNK